MAISTITKQGMDAAVYDALLADIKNGTWKSGEKLPSETDLGQKMGVSRVTVRAAIQRLQAIGLVEVKHGKGTYVVKPEEIYDMSNFERELDLTEKDELMVVGVAPWIYLYTDAGCGNYSTWQVHEGSTQLYDYYDLHPDKFPDVVYMAHWAEEFMACDLSHLFTDREYETVYQGTGTVLMSPERAAVFRAETGN